MSHCISSMASSGIGVHATGSAHLKGGGQATICTLKQRMDPVLFGYRPKLSTADLSLHGWQKLSIINWHSCLCSLNQISFLNRAQYSELSWTKAFHQGCFAESRASFPPNGWWIRCGLHGTKAAVGLGDHDCDSWNLKPLHVNPLPIFSGWIWNPHEFTNILFPVKVHPSQDFVGWVAKDDWRIW